MNKLVFIQPKVTSTIRYERVHEVCHVALFAQMGSLESSLTLVACALP